jgi:hypothetical protein
MRLIDADALKAHFAWWKNDDMKDIFNTIVELQPTVDPERHARWQEPEGGDGPGERLVTFRCSACGASDLHANGMIVPYCWHCGAKMNGGENDE